MSISTNQDKKLILKVDGKPYYLYSPFSEIQSPSDSLTAFFDLLKTPAVFKIKDIRFSTYDFDGFQKLSDDTLSNTILKYAKSQFDRPIIFRALYQYDNNELSLEEFKNILSYYDIFPEDILDSETTDKTKPVFSKKKLNTVIDETSFKVNMALPVITDLQEKHLTELIPPEQITENANNQLSPNSFATFVDTDKNANKWKTKLESNYNFLVEQGLIPILCFIQGSQNYFMDKPTSDIDMKTFVVQQDWKNANKPFSKTFEREVVKQKFDISAPELLDCKSFQKFKDTFLKMNPSYVEFLYSRAYICNPVFEPIVKKFFDNKEQLLHWGRYEFMKGILGFMGEKLHAFNKPFASKKDIVAEYGYDPKQYHHLERLKHQWKNFLICFSEPNAFHPKLASNPYLFTNSKEFDRVIKIKEQPEKMTPEQVEKLKAAEKQKLAKKYQWLDKYYADNKKSIDADQLKLKQWFEKEIEPEILKIQKQFQVQKIVEDYDLTNDSLNISKDNFSK